MSYDYQRRGVGWFGFEWSTQQKAFEKALLFARTMHCKYKVYSVKFGTERVWKIRKFEESFESVISKLIDQEKAGYDGFNTWGGTYAQDERMGNSGEGAMRERSLPPGDASGRYRTDSE